MKDWPIETLWSRENLTASFGSSTVDFYPNNLDRANAHPYLIPFSEALDVCIYIDIIIDIVIDIVVIIV